MLNLGRKKIQFVVDSRAKLWALFSILAVSIFPYACFSSGQKEDIRVGQYYIKESNLSCGSVDIRIVTKCFESQNNLFPACFEQNVSFIDNKNDVILSTIERPGEVALAELAMSWACVTGKNEQFLLIGYYNGGNCEDCEWYELFDLSGHKLASSNNKLRDNGSDSFEHVHKKLRLPKIWPRESFVKIPLLEKE